MKSTVSILILFLAIVVLMHPLAALTEEERKVLYWHDPMVPGPKFDKPGKSPFMDMELVPVYADESVGASDDMKGTIRINPAFIQNTGVRTAEVRHQIFGKKVRAYARFTANPRLTRKVALRVEGWISKLMASAAGDSVKAGDVLFDLYSPDLVSAQKDYMAAKKSGMDARVKATQERLRLLGMDEKVFSKLKKSGKVMKNIPFHAPVSGTVSVLNVQEGAYVKTGEDILTIQDFSSIWVEVNVAEKDLRFLQAGQKADIHIQGRAGALQTQIDFIHPVVDEKTRTGKVRLIVTNDGTLRPGQFADVIFAGDHTFKRLAVPREAVLYDGNGAHVMQAVGEGRFRARPVETGMVSGELIEIVSGLTAGDSIVISGQFLIDSDARLRTGMSSMQMEEDSHAHE